MSTRFDRLEATQPIVDGNGYPSIGFQFWAQRLLESLEQALTDIETVNAEQASQLELIEAAQADIAETQAEQAAQLVLIEDAQAAILEAQADIIDALELAGIALDAAEAAQGSADAVALANAIGDSYTAPSSVLMAESFDTYHAIANRVGTTVTSLGAGLYRIEKTGGGAGWDADAVSATGLTGNFTLKLIPFDTTHGTFGGMSTNPAPSSSYTNPNFGIAFDVGGVVEFYESGGYTGYTTAYAGGDIWWLRRTGMELDPADPNYAKIQYIQGGATPSAGTARRTTASSATLFFDSSFITAGGKLDASLLTTDAKITIDDHTRFYGDSINLAVTGAILSGQPHSTDIAVYYDDVTRADATPAFTATTNLTIAQNNYVSGRHLVGTVTTPASGGAAATGGTTPPGSGYTPGGGGGFAIP